MWPHKPSMTSVFTKDKKKMVSEKKALVQSPTFDFYLAMSWIELNIFQMWVDFEADAPWWCHERLFEYFLTPFLLYPEVFSASIAETAHFDNSQIGFVDVFSSSSFAWFSFLLFYFFRKLCQHAFVCAFTISSKQKSMQKSLPHWQNTHPQPL